MPFETTPPSPRIPGPAEHRDSPARGATEEPCPDTTLDGVWLRELLADDHGDAPGLFEERVEHLRRASLELRARLTERAAAGAPLDPATRDACQHLAATARELGLGRLAALLREARAPDPDRAGPAPAESVSPARLAHEIDHGLAELLERADEVADTARFRDV